MITKVCKICGKNFRVAPIRKNNAKCCSRKCMNLFALKGTFKKCKQCRKKFYVRLYLIKRKQGIFCSRKCFCKFKKLKSKKIIKKCKQCEKEFKTYHKNANFCCQQCAGKFKQGKSNSSKGIKRPQQSGEKCGAWKGGITSKYHKVRTSLEIKLWKINVFKKNNFACQKCGDNKGGNLKAHHIFNFAQYPKLRTSIKNGITLCEKCHIKFHNKYGYTNNNKEQIDKFLKK